MMMVVGVLAGPAVPWLLLPPLLSVHSALTFLSFPLILLFPPCLFVRVLLLRLPLLLFHLFFLLPSSLFAALPLFLSTPLFIFHFLSVVAAFAFVPFPFALLWLLLPPPLNMFRKLPLDFLQTIPDMFPVASMFFHPLQSFPALFQQAFLSLEFLLKLPFLMFALPPLRFSCVLNTLAVFVVRLRI